TTIESHNDNLNFRPNNHDSVLLSGAGSTSTLHLVPWSIMAIRTEPTHRISDKARTDSGIHDSRIATRVPLRSGSSGTSPLPNISSERPSGKLRPVSPSIHETVVPDRKLGTSSYPLR